MYVYNACTGHIVTQDNRHFPPAHLFLPRYVDPRLLAWDSVTGSGSKITVSNSSVSLTIPQGAVSLAQDMYVAVLNQDHYKPQLDSSQTPVTPVVQCGPADATHCLQKPVVLTVPHIIGNGVAVNSRRIMRVLFCADLDHEDAQWRLIQPNGDSADSADDVADGESGVYMQVDSTTVHLVTERLGAYVLVANVTDINQIGGCEPRTSSVVASSSGCSSLGSPLFEQQNSVAMPTPSILSATTKAALSRCLDVPSCEGNGWKQLSEVIGAGHYSAFFASQVSPASALLGLWESRNRDPEPLQALASLLREIRREDAIVILEREIKK